MNNRYSYMPFAAVLVAFSAPTAHAQANLPVSLKSAKVSAMRFMVVEKAQDTKTVSNADSEIKTETKYVESLNKLEQAINALQAEIDDGNKKIKEVKPDYQAALNRFIEKRTALKDAYMVYSNLRTDYQKIYNTRTDDFINDAGKDKEKSKAISILYKQARQNTYRAIAVREMYGDVQSNALDYYSLLCPSASATANNYFKTRPEAAGPSPVL